MTTSFPSRPVTSALWRSKSPGEPEFQAIFQLLGSPALLIEHTKEQVVLANSQFLTLTAFASNEVIKLNLRELVSGLPSHPLASEDIQGVQLERRNRSPLAVNVQIRSLDGSGQWLAILFEPVEEGHKDLADCMDQVVQAMLDLRRVPVDEPLRAMFERSLTIILNLFGVSAAALYRAEGSDGQVWKAVVVGEKDLLPETLPSSDFARLSQTYIWKLGRRVQTDLHRAARVQNFAYLASTPVNPGMLLVVGERRQAPPEQLSIVLEAVGKQISAGLEHISQIADLRRLAMEKRRELGIWRSVGENAQEGVLLLAPDLTVSEMNPAAEWLLGYADWEVRGQPVENILIGPERLGPSLEMACQGIPTHNMGNVSLHRRNGQAFPAHIQIVPVEREGENLAVIIFFTDVSEHVEIRNRTQQLEQRAVLGEVTAVFAHEVRNPINNISTGLQLMSVKLPENDPNQENIVRLLNDCQRLNHLMESVLNFSRQTEHKFEEVNLDQLLRRLLDRWRPRMAKVNVTSFYHITENTPNVLGDPRSLDQVFTNLISNAVEAMTEKGGTLAVRVAPFTIQAGRPQVEITISDSGPGIPDDIRDRIFEPFVTNKSQGTGLGLAITKRIVTAHRGGISVNSFPGGTVFQVLLSAYQGETA